MGQRYLLRPDYESYTYSLHFNSPMFYDVRLSDVNVRENKERVGNSSGSSKAQRISLIRLRRPISVVEWILGSSKRDRCTTRSIEAPADMKWLVIPRHKTTLLATCQRSLMRPYTVGEYASFFHWSGEAEIVSKSQWYHLGAQWVALGVWHSY